MITFEDYDLKGKSSECDYLESVQKRLDVPTAASMLCCKDKVVTQYLISGYHEEVH